MFDYNLLPWDNKFTKNSYGAYLSDDEIFNMHQILNYHKIKYSEKIYIDDFLKIHDYCYHVELTIETNEDNDLYTMLINGN